MKPKPIYEDTERDPEFERFGMAAVTVGIQKSIDYLQEMLFNLQVRMAASESLNAAPRVTARTVVNRITKAERIAATEPAEREEAKTRLGKASSSSKLKAYWAKMTPEEKSAEMKRRGMVRKKRQKINADHPGKPTHPDHAQWLINVQRGREAAKRARAKAAAKAAAA